MDLNYDLFEQFPDGSVLWCAFVRGLENTRQKLQELATRSPNEYFAIHTPSKDIVGRVNVPEVKTSAQEPGLRDHYSVV